MSFWFAHLCVYGIYMWMLKVDFSLLWSRPTLFIDSKSLSWTQSPLIWASLDSQSPRIPSPPSKGGITGGLPCPSSIYVGLRTWTLLLMLALQDLIHQTISPDPEVSFKISRNMAFLIQVYVDDWSYDYARTLSMNYKNFFKLSENSNLGMQHQINVGTENSGLYQF